MTEPAAPAVNLPVVLLHGTNDRCLTMEPLTDALAMAGREVVNLDYGLHRRSLRGLGGAGGNADLARSAIEISHLIDELLAGGEADQVDVIGHSQGGLHALSFARLRPGVVRRLVLLGTPVHGVRPFGGASHLAHAPGVSHAMDSLLGPAARAHVAGSRFLREHAGVLLDLHPLSPLMVATRQDRLVRPSDLVSVAALPNLRLVWVQDEEPGRQVSHAGLPGDPLVIRLVLDELAR